jgi:acyl carrier protein
MDEEMRKIILEYVIKEYTDEDSDEVTYSTPLISGGLVDSFSMVSLKRFLEVKYKISIPDDQATPEAFDSVDKIVILVKKFVK